MLRTQEAALNGFGPDSLAVLCEAICLDAVEVTSANRVSIWFFDAKGDMVCKRLLNARDGRFQEGAVIPKSATAAYVDAASQGLASMVTEDAPTMPEAAGDEVKARLDMLLVDIQNRPAAIFRCERNTGDDDWRARDITILRNLAQTLAAAIRDQSLRDAAARDLPLGPVTQGDIGSVKQDLSWLRQGGEPSIWLQSIEAAQAFDALGLNASALAGLEADPLFDLDEDEAF